MNPLILLLFGFLLALYAVWPSVWIIVVAAVVLILVGAFKVMVAR